MQSFNRRKVIGDGLCGDLTLKAVVTMKPFRASGKAGKGRNL